MATVGGNEDEVPKRPPSANLLPQGVRGGKPTAAAAGWESDHPHQFRHGIADLGKAGEFVAGRNSGGLTGRPSSSASKLGAARKTA